MIIYTPKPSKSGRGWNYHLHPFLNRTRKFVKFLPFSPLIKAFVFLTFTLNSNSYLFSKLLVSLIDLQVTHLLMPSPEYKAVPLKILIPLAIPLMPLDNGSGTKRNLTLN